MATNLVQAGKIIQWKNETGGTITPGTLVWIGGIPGIALVNLADVV